MMIGRSECLPHLPLGDELLLQQSNPSKKRRSRSPLMPKKARKSRSKSPVSRTAAPGTSSVGVGMTGNCSSSNTMTPDSRRASLDVQIIKPSVQGLSEAAKILRSSNGVLSLPTETFYCKSSFVPFQRPVRDPDANSPKILSDTHSSLWERVISNHLRHEVKVNPRDGPFLFVNNPLQARYFVSPGRSKTFVHKEPVSEKSQVDVLKGFLNPLECSSQGPTYTAVTFIESMEVLDRLSSAFWPGPISIFAPVRMRSPKEPRETKCDEDTEATPTLRRASSTSSSSNFSSSNSLLSMNSLDGVSQQIDPTAVPIFPLSALASSTSLSIAKSGEKDTYFVGMRCSAHPLTRRVIEKSYPNPNPSNKKLNTTENGPKRIKGAIFGFSESIPSKANRDGIVSQPMTTKDLCSNLKRQRSPEKEKMYVLNGEDKQEIFHVPTCQYGRAQSISLVIDSGNRTVILLRDGASKGSNDNIDISVRDIQRALYQCKDKTPSVKSKVIATVIKRWTVVERQND